MFLFHLEHFISLKSHTVSHISSPKKHLYIFQKLLTMVSVLKANKIKTYVQLSAHKKLSVNCSLTKTLCWVLHVLLFHDFCINTGNFKPLNSLNTLFTVTFIHATEQAASSRLLIIKLCLLVWLHIREVIHNKYIISIVYFKTVSLLNLSCK